MEKGSVQVLDRAFELLDLICRSQGGITIQRLSAITGLHKSTVHRILQTLVRWRCVQKSEQDAIYRPGLYICELSEIIQSDLDIVSISRPILEQLSDDVSGTVHMAMRDNLDIVYIHKAISQNCSIYMASRIGARRPMYCTGVGKAILATMRDKEIEGIWDKSEIKAYTANTIVDKEQFLQEIRKIRERGYAYDNEENEIGVRCIATSIPVMGNASTYAVSISLPASQIVQDGEDQLIEPLMRARESIVRAAGG